MLGKLRHKYESMMMPVGSVLARTGITPNQMTLVSLLSAIAACLLYVKYGPLAGALGIVLVGITDMLDGSLARASGKVTRFGGVLDHVVDRYAEFLIVWGIAQAGLASWAAAMYAIFGMVMASYTRAEAEGMGGLPHCRVGIAERQEKLLTIMAGSIVAWLRPDLGRQAMTAALLIAGTLSHITVIQRLLYTRRHAR